MDRYRKRRRTFLRIDNRDDSVKTWGVRRRARRSGRARLGTPPLFVSLSPPARVCTTLRGSAPASLFFQALLDPPSPGFGFTHLRYTLTLLLDCELLVVRDRALHLLPISVSHHCVPSLSLALGDKSALDLRLTPKEARAC